MCMIDLKHLSEKDENFNNRQWYAEWYSTFSFAVPMAINKYVACDWVSIPSEDRPNFPYSSGLNNWKIKDDPILRELLIYFFEIGDIKPNEWAHYCVAQYNPQHYFMFMNENHKIIFDLLMADFNQKNCDNS